MRVSVHVHGAETHTCQACLLSRYFYDGVQTLDEL